MTRVGQVRLTIVALAALAVTVSAAPTPATKPYAPQWRCYFALHQPKIVAVNRRSIWFRQHMLLWRYDFQTQTTHPFSFMDGYRAGSFSRLAADDSGSFALTDQKNALLLAPPKGWRSLPNWRGPERLRSMHFGADGSLLGLRRGQLLRWTGRAWEKVGPFPATVGAARMPKGWLLWDSTTNNQYACDRFRVLADGQQKAKPCPTNQPDGVTVTFKGPVLRTGGKTYVYVGRSTKNRGTSGVLAAVTPEGLRLLPPEQVWFGIDMTGEGFVKAAIHSSVWGGFYWRVTTPEGKQLPPVHHHGGNAPIVLRDPNGHIWCNADRWDGKEWKRVLPGCVFPYHRQMTLALDGARFRLDGKTGRWRTMAPGVPEDVSGYNPKTRTGWMHRYGGAHRGLLFVRVGKDGKITVLRRIAGAPSGQPLFRSPDGNWWWRYNDIIVRVDADGKVHTHSGHARVKPGTVSRPSAVLSPKGNVWMWHMAGYWARFDGKSGQFVRAKPYDEFAFRFGPWMLSVVGERPVDYTHDLRMGGEVGQVFRKDKGGWKAMPSPFDPGGLYCTRKMIRGDRMLVTCSLGAFEYDAANDRWAFLHRQEGLVAGFDDAGRRILIARSWRRYVLVLDGDPFAIKGDAAIAEITTMSRLLKLMDHSDWRVREKATERAKKLGASCRARLQAALARDDLSLEVRLRIKEVLKDTNTSLSVALPSLFDFMHPPLKRVDAVITPQNSR